MLSAQRKSSSLLKLGHAFSRYYASVGGSKKDDCIKLECNPEIKRLDTCHPKEPKEHLKQDPLTAFAPCPPPQPKKKFTCGEIPKLQATKKRKPLLLAASCKKPKKAPVVDDCGRLKIEACPKVRFPNCPLARVPPTCPLPVRRTCTKTGPQFPAFSECYRRPKNDRVNECDCLSNRKTC